jgi:hypothetical protein
VSFVFQKKNLSQKAQLSAAFSPAPLRGDIGRILRKMVGTDFCAFCFFKKGHHKKTKQPGTIEFRFCAFCVSIRIYFKRHKRGYPTICIFAKLCLPFKTSLPILNHPETPIRHRLPHPLPAYNFSSR